MRLERELPELASDSRLRLQTSVRLRWFAVAGQLVTVAAVSLWFGFAMPLGYCLGLIVLSAWLNVFLRLRFPARHRLSAQLGTGLIAYDILQLAALLFLTGGITNPFMPLIIAPVTVAAATLPPRNTVLLGALAGLLSMLLATYHLALPWPASAPLELPYLYKTGLLTAVLAGMIFQALYALRLAKESRLMSAALAATELILAREQKLHALDGLAAAAAHELGTPLSTITLVAKELNRSLPADSAMAEDLSLLQAQAVRCREILQKLTRSPGERDPLHAMLTVTQLIEEAATPYRGRKARIVIEAHPAPGTAGPASEEPVGERRPGVIYGVGNLIENAVDFAHSTVAVTATWSEQSLTVTIVDDGPGFQADLIESIGEPYVTTRSTASRAAKESGAPAGLGLGLFIAKTLLERSGATITLENRPRPENGAIVTISWPRAVYQTSEGVFGRERRAS